MQTLSACDGVCKEETECTSVVRLIVGSPKAPIPGVLEGNTRTRGEASRSRR